MPRKLFKLVGEVTLEGMAQVNKGLVTVDKNARKAERTIAKFGKNMSAVGANLTKFVTVPLVAFGAAAFKGVEAASDLNETISKTGEIFNESSKEIEDWSKTAAEAFGQSRQQAMDAASTFAIFGKSAGLTGDSLVDFSKQFTVLASDLASFFNTRPEDAITAIGAAFRGENEPIRRFGVLLDDASLRTKALELGIVSTTKNALTPQQKVMAAGALIMEQTADAQGDFQRTSDQLANSSRILTAQVKDLTAEFGQAFLPIALDLVNIFRDNFLPVIKSLIDRWNSLSPATHETIVTIGAMIATIGPLLLGLGKLIVITKSFTAAILLMNTALLANPFFLAAAAVGALTAAVIAANKAWTAWHDNIGKNVAEKQARAIKDDIEELIPLYNELALMNRQAIGEERFKELSEQVKILETNLGDAGIAFEGSFGRRAIAAENYLTDLIITGEEVSETVEEVTKKTREQIAAEEELARKRAALAKKLAQDKAKFETDITEQLNTQVDNREVALEREYDEAIANAERLGTDKDQIELLFFHRRNALADEMLEEERTRIDAEAEAHRQAEEKKRKEAELTAEKAREKARETGRFIVGMFRTAASAVSGIFSGISENQSLMLENEIARRRETIEQTIKSEKEKEAALEALDEEAAKRKRALMRRRAVQEKAGALFAAVINVAQGITKAIGQTGVLGAVFGALVAALGAIQIGIIASRPIPFQKGGFIKGGRGGITGQIGEGEQDEIIFPLKTGIEALADAFLSKLRDIEFPTFEPPRPAVAAAIEQPTNASVGGTVNVNIGTLIADEFGLKELERRMRGIRISENQRRGKI